MFANICYRFFKELLIEVMILRLTFNIDPYDEADIEKFSFYNLPFSITMQFSTLA